MCDVMNSPPSRKATIATCANGGRPSHSAATMLAAPSIRIASLAIINRLRSTRSARAPAGIAKIASGSHLAKPTTPALAAEPVSVRTNNG
jgi:hypothetical protein